MRLSFFRFGEAANFVDQIGDDGDVDEEQKRARDSRMVVKNVNLKRNQPSRGNDGQKFRPPFAQRQANSFRKKQRRIDKRANS